ncbi:MAG: isopentenyl-diphosphate Delta-isomerase [Parabacteroides sp.]|jgi:isopentenyl-diphosphate delta-isomerase|uniref:Isopentenyl-diphosphate delta-isomerase n=1 Tax=Parabacteroides chartae TaxID=1037355 RepID=A0A1T5DIL9_9BACT|nr:isopentenyl-diphosphate Delta-isomerase [Parabacteroides chartae]MCD8471215.1 isopentenyl-diphosphate Delta-isomerase [Parabacteroides chartae]MDD3508636.1 isopentenyl-diphosphate Delta-isomerase [Parabacteroides sp.]SKB71526.1 isopentenyl-diphosphate delta-isomerase [Parabacteroides chartae]HNU37815.1 isopentenyl-diphosphate Delta-isomerase [Macellibacteroides fermentans]
MVILVDENDNPIGTMPKMEAHEKAMLHRAFSVFILNANDEVLLQQRANDKYHSAGLWTNTCCSHPHPGEDTLGAARRRLKEEMGMEADLQFVFKFMYKAPFDNLLTEHEIDHVFIGKTDQLPVINPEEVASYKYMKPEDIKLDMEQNPQSYTVWFRIIFNEFYKEIFTHKLAV